MLELRNLEEKSALENKKLSQKPNIHNYFFVLCKKLDNSEKIHYDNLLSIIHYCTTADILKTIK